MTPVFEYSDYREFIKSRLGDSGKRNGNRLRACETIGCHSTYLSQVLAEKIDISLEHAQGLAKFFDLSKDEEKFFLLLVMHSRAGNKALEAHFKYQIDEILTSRMDISKRISESKKLSDKDESKFYSNWLYGALHVLVSIKEFQTLSSISRATGFSEFRLLEELNFLCETGLIQNKSGRYTIGPKMVHIGNDSSSVLKHHTNWRYHTIQNLNRRRPQDLHYSAVLTLTEKAAKEIRDNLLRVLEKNMKIVEKAEEETCYVHCFDLYQLTP